MSILRRLHARRLAVILGSSLLCLLGLVAGCDSGGDSGTAPVNKTEIQAKQDAEKEARLKAFGKTGAPGKAQAAPASKPKS
ncbi:MAG: hypothetical protein ACP5XB_31635 [Isosphaeraceae bacterium]